MSLDWLPKLAEGNRGALARAITAVENETADAQAVLAEVQPRLGCARVIGLTGSPGAGKSTLVSALVAAFREQDLSVGVVAVDPSSPLTGGAILGDRVRMSDHAGDPGVFVRSLASRGHVGGLSRTAARVVDVMDAAGRDRVVVETVGAGQSEVEIAGLAQTRIVVVAPGMGDDIQAVKAGILEIADILVVNKGDQPLAQASAAQLGDMVSMTANGTTGGAWSPPVIITTAVTGEGIPELAQAIDAHGRWLAEHPRGLDPQGRTRQLVATLAGQRLTDALLESGDRALEDLLARVARGETDFDSAAREALKLMSQAP
ncbi:methylmalonyl Co-A mutase-associated GTPase MeaB [Magnetospira sp. QH-2]|uniref:methylmalonyl Co-A mutase-associated GTPase MeaB n=1 Tax=Magnetospira sp. (strain QH-2) TaxID=1288970 RepID=UPI0003E816E2|nr:methylmalonyl Co-A mutase-associated GTPase MeaB [Magnetospira sp. QH-2]CCQ73021.1 conserved protein of unknown function [Magnetospira sp. QH-2]